MDAMPPRFRHHVIAFAVIVLLAWGGLFLRGMFPFGEHGGGFLDAPLLLAFALVLVAFALWLASLVSPVPGAARGTSFGGRRAGAMLVTGLAAVVLFIFLPPGDSGLRLGGRMGILLQPVRDLQNSPAVAKIAAAGQPALLPEEEWPASLEEWQQLVYAIEVTRLPDRRPQIRVAIGGRGSRYHHIVIHPLKEPQDDRDHIHSRWTEDVWLTRILGE